MGLLIITEAEVRRIVERGDVIESQRVAYLAAANGEMRSEGVLTSWDHDDDVLVFAVTGAIAEQTGVAFKIGSQMSANASRVQSSLHSIVILTDPTTGAPIACLEGSSLTALRTSGGVAAAVDALAPKDVATLGIYGAGPQAREVVRMVSAIRDIRKVLIFSRERQHRDALVRLLNDDALVAAHVAGAEDSREVASASGIVITCTSSLAPVFEGEWLQCGATVATVGSFAPERREIDVRTSERASGIFVDDVAKSYEWSGPVREMRDRETIAHEVTAIGTVLAGQHPGRTDRDEILVFHSLGLAIQDAALGWLVYNRARDQGLGTYVEY